MTAHNLQGLSRAASLRTPINTDPLINSYVMRRALFFLICLFAAGCQTPRLPEERLNQYTYTTSFQHTGDRLEVQIANPLQCPLRVWLQSADTILMQKFSALNPIVLPPVADTTLLFQTTDITAAVVFASRLGDITKKVRPVTLQLPFNEGNSYKVIQGNDTDFTHNTDYSRYAIDFSLQKGDTVCAAHSGYVVGVIEGYKYGGKEAKWRNFGNFITLYAPEAGIFTQYAHLAHNGSFVKIGDWVEAGTPIGLSGLTGQTTVAHLHFNTLVPEHSNAGLRSIPSTFEEGYKSMELKKGDVVRKKD
jgi:murein DD-endopeptidase MepM/ murein hydrolase activator NlpD